MERDKIKRREVLRFLVGGGSAVMTDYMAYVFLLHMGIDMSVSKAVSYVCGAAVGFVINKYWTFGSSVFSKMEIARYILLYAASACVIAGVNKLVMAAVGLQVFAFLCATGVSTVLNFLGQKYFVFRKGA